MARAWKVYCNGKDTGIVETNFNFAAHYWSVRQTRTGNIYRLVEV